jgi:hypothetical protein
MSQEHQIVKNFLNEVTTGGKPAFQSLKRLLEILEEKVDPDPVELELVGVIYQFFESFSHLDNVLKRYRYDENKSLLGNKISELYETYSPNDSSKILID